MGKSILRSMYGEKKSNAFNVTIPKTEKILAANIVDQTEDTCKAEFTIVDNNVAAFTFYCLEPEQGATINLYHTNINEVETKVEGKIKGGKIINKTFELLTENGELIVSNGIISVYFSGGFMGIGSSFYRMILSLLEFTVKVRDKK